MRSRNIYKEKSNLSISITESFYSNLEGMNVGNILLSFAQKIKIEQISGHIINREQTKKQIFKRYFEFDESKLIN